MTFHTRELDLNRFDWEVEPMGDEFVNRAPGFDLFGCLRFA